MPDKYDLDKQISELKKNPELFNKLISLGTKISNLENKFKDIIKSGCDKIINVSNCISEKTEELKDKVKSR